MADMNRRNFVSVIGLGALAAVLPLSCGEGEEAPQGRSRSRLSRAYTSERPGDYANKVDSHVPSAEITRLDDAGNFRIDVVVQHEMRDQHWIQNIAIEDQDERELATMNLQPGPERAEATFTVNLSGVTQVHVFSLCNLHGLWVRDYAIMA